VNAIDALFNASIERLLEKSNNPLMAPRGIQKNGPISPGGE
jgi:hypothetical protein